MHRVPQLDGSRVKTSPEPKPDLETERKARVKRKEEKKIEGRIFAMEKMNFGSKRTVGYKSM